MTTFSTSAKNKIVVLSDLPNSSTPNIGTIPSHFLFPSVGRLNSNPPFNLHSDGSIYQLFEMRAFSMQDVNKIVDSMIDDCDGIIFLNNKNMFFKWLIPLYSFTNKEPFNVYKEKDPISKRPEANS